jgi:hypothetical protein
MRVYLSQRNNAADSVTLSGTYVWGTAAPWNFDESNLATCDISGATFAGMGEFTLGSSVSGGATFNLAAGEDVVLNGADIDGSSIVGTGDLVINSATNANLSNVTIAGNVRVNIASDTSLTWTNVIVTGDVFNDAASNTLTITAVGSTLSTTEPGTGNGQVNIVNEATVTFDKMKDNTEVRVYATGTSNELAGIENATAGTADNRNFAASVAVATVVDYTLVNSLYEIIRVNGFTWPSVNQTIDIQQRLDRNYSNPA